MTVSTSYAPLTYAGNSATTAFPATWPFFTGSVVVTAIDSSGVETVKTINTDYSVSGGTDANGLPATGTVTMFTPPASGTTLRLTRVTARTQGATWSENDAFPQAVIEAALDRAALIDQETTAAAVAGITGDMLQLNTAGAVDYWDGEAHVLSNLANPSAAQDAVTKAYADVNYGSASSVAAAASAAAASASASAASASAAASALTSYLVGFRWTYSTSTTMADPGSGNIRFNSVTLSSVTALAVSDFSADGGSPDVSPSVLTWDDSTNTLKGTLTFRKASATQNYAEYQITALTDNSLWSQVTLTYLSGSGGFSNGDVINVVFARTGDKGSAGAGTGDMLAANNLSDLANKATARTSSGLNVDQLKYTVGDANYSILATDRTVGTNAAFTAPRTWTLPAANAVNAGQEIIVADYVNGVTSSNTLTIARAGADTINGATSVAIAAGYGAYLLKSDGVSKWSAQALGTASPFPVTSVLGRTGAVVAAAGDYTLAQLYNAPITPMGRLTLTTVTPVLTATVSAASTVYYTPYIGQFVPIYDGTRFIATDTGGELSQATTDNTKSPAGVTTNSNYDIFVWSDSGTIRATRGPAWTSSTARGAGAGTTELQRINGIWTNKVSITNGPGANRGTYVGSIRSNGTSTIDFHFGAAASGGTAALLGVWNMYNRVNVVATVTDNGTSYTYATATIRQARASSGMQVSFISGLAEDSPLANYCAQASTGTTVGNQFAFDVGAMDSTSAYCVAGANVAVNTVANAAQTVGAVATGYYAPQLGWHFIAAVERSDAGTSTFNQGSDTLFVSFRM